MITVRHLRVYITPESAEQGDYASTEWLDETGIQFETVAECIKWLERNGFGFPSNSEFHPSLWYDTEPEQDYLTGDYSYESAFLEAPENWKKAVYMGLTANRK